LPWQIPLGGNVYWVRTLSRRSRAFFWMGVARAAMVKGMPGAVAIQLRQRATTLEYMVDLSVGCR
jgi:hypothetical protein